MSGYHLRSLSESLQNTRSWFTSKHPPLLVRSAVTSPHLLPSSQVAAGEMPNHVSCLLPLSSWCLRSPPVLPRLQHWAALPSLAFPGPLPAIDMLRCSDHTPTRHYIPILLSAESLSPSPEREPCWLAQSSCSVRICDE